MKHILLAKLKESKRRVIRDRVRYPESARQAKRNIRAIIRQIKIINKES